MKNETTETRDERHAAAAADLSKKHGINVTWLGKAFRVIDQNDVRSFPLHGIEGLTSACRKLTTKEIK